MSKLEEAGLIEVEKEFVGKKPQTLLRLTDAGRHALDQYGNTMQDLLDAIATE
jgi:DNA-binding PadR family transcriptional regulator